MTSTVFTTGTTIAKEWLNAVNSATYSGGAVYTPAGTGSVPTTVQSKLRESVSVKDFGAVGDGVADDTAAIQAALDSPGLSPIYFPEGNFKVTGTGSACLTLSKNRMIFGCGRASIIRADNSSNSTDIFRIAFTDNGGYGDVRQFVMRDLAMFPNVGGRHALTVDSNSPYLGVFGAIFDNLGLSGNEANSGRSIVFTSLSFCTIQNCQLGTGITGTNVADGNRIINNMISGTYEGIGLNIQLGSYETIIANNAIVCRDGAIVITSGSQVKILNNQIEQVGVNASYLSHSVFLQGLDYECTAIDIIGNNFGGGYNMDNSIVIGKASDTRISLNRFNITNNSDILLGADASYNYVFFDNQVTGGTRRTDKFRLIISDTGVGNYGVLKNTGGISSGGYSAADYYKDPSTEDVIFGGANSGFVVGATVIATFPVGFKPYGFHTLPAATSAGTFAVYTNPTSGALVISSTAPSNSAVAEGVRFPAKRGA